MTTATTSINATALNNAIAAQLAAQEAVKEMMESTFPVGTSVRWYKETPFKGWQRFDGTVLSCDAVASKLLVQRDNSEVKYWVSLYQLRFWLHNTTPDAVLAEGGNPADQVF